jgi:hypothetical protein
MSPLIDQQALAIRLHFVAREAERDLLRTVDVMPVPKQISGSKTAARKQIFCQPDLW